jgi:hypothetical protein
MLEDRILQILPIYGSYGEFAKILNCSIAGVRQALDKLIASGRVRRTFDDKGRPVYERGIEQTVPQLLARIAELEAELATLRKPKKERPESKEMVVKEIPLITMLLKNGKEFGVTRQLYEDMARGYPQLDVMNEMRKMKLWCSTASVHDRKTSSRMPKFINGWLSRATGTAQKPRSVAERVNVANRIGQERLL